jgi:ArsR family transcriptional regulator
MMKMRPIKDTGSLSAQVVKALANESRLQIMRWLRDPRAHFPPQVDGDLVKDGVCGLFIAQKLGVGQPTASEHLRILVQAGLIRGKRLKQWTFYKRDEKRIVEVKTALRDGW